MTGLNSDASNARYSCESGQAAEFARIAEPVLEDMGFRLVRVSLGGAERLTVQIMVERPDGSISISECADISRALSPLFDVHDPIDGSYVLEVSSPGIDRPLVRPSDFEDWAGYEAKIELTELLDGRKRFRGVLEGFEDGEVRLEVDLDQIGRTVLGLPLDLIANARLILTDRLIEEALARQKNADRSHSTGQDVQKDERLRIETVEGVDQG